VRTSLSAILGFAPNPFGAGTQPQGPRPLSALLSVGIGRKL
jgi:hypothetical protein